MLRTPWFTRTCMLVTIAVSAILALFTLGLGASIAYAMFGSSTPTSKHALQHCDDGTHGVEGQLCVHGTSSGTSPTSIVNATTPIARSSPFAQLAFTNPDLDVANYMFWDQTTDHEFLVVHSQAQASKAKVRTATGIRVDIADELARAHVTESTPVGNGVSPAEWCASQCKNADECDAIVVVDHASHVELALPCANGKAGTWVVTKLP
jgi:hypothetical protein